MKSFFTFRFALAFLFATTAPSLLAQTNEPPIAPTQRVELFDGRSLSGWTFVSKDTNAPAESIWSVTNGVIACQGKPNGYARTLQAYRDYKLHVEWRWPEGPATVASFCTSIRPTRCGRCVSRRNCLRAARAKSVATAARSCMN